jgi:hypothetical protein
MPAFAYDLPDDSQGLDDNTLEKFTAGVYFDGTHNNRYNVEARENVENNRATEEERKAYRKHQNDTSYENFKSNVDIMQREVSKHMASIYVQGIGTMKWEGNENMWAGSHGRGDGSSPLNLCHLALAMGNRKFRSIV